MNTTFAIFLNSLRTLNPVLVESVAAGYKLIYENGNDAEITDDVLFAEFLKQYPNSTREEFDSIRITAPGIFSSIRADLIKLATGTPIIGNDGSERAFPFAMDGTTQRRARPSLEAYEDYNPPHPDEPDSYPTDYTNDDTIENPNPKFDHSNYRGHRYMLEIDPDWQKAVDFIGDRYQSGYEIYDMVIRYLRDGDQWGAGKAVTAQLPENVAWALRDMLCDEEGNIDREATGMLADSVLGKLQSFFDQIV